MLDINNDKDMPTYCAIPAIHNYMVIQSLFFALSIGFPSCPRPNQNRPASRFWVTSHDPPVEKHWIGIHETPCESLLTCFDMFELLESTLYLWEISKHVKNYFTWKFYEVAKSHEFIDSHSYILVSFAFAPVTVRFRGGASVWLFFTIHIVQNHTY